MIIGICDDDSEDRQKIELICRKTLLPLPIVYEIILFVNAEEFLSCGLVVDLLILDIELSGLNGIDVKNCLQKKKKDIMIIFVSNHNEMVLSAFGINVYGFIEKKYLEKKFPHMLESAVSILNQYILLDGDMNSKEILYVKSERIYSRLYLSDGTNKLIRKSLNELQSQLESVGFIRTHRGYLVNCGWVRRLGNREITINGTVIPISSRKQGEVRRQYKEYCEKNARYC